LPCPIRRCTTWHWHGRWRCATNCCSGACRPRDCSWGRCDCRPGRKAGPPVPNWVWACVESLLMGFVQIPAKILPLRVHH
jgi:hypothetical protein